VSGAQQLALLAQIVRLVLQQRIDVTRRRKLRNCVRLLDQARWE
jgi:hypothetical protein